MDKKKRKKRREKLLESQPENVTYQADVAMTQNNLGILQMDMDRMEDALQSFKRAV